MLINNKDCQGAWQKTAERERVARVRSMTAPNVAQLIGDELCVKLISKAGGLVGLANLSDAALRHLGTEDFADSLKKSSLAKQLHAGYLIEAPVFTAYFGQDADSADITKSAQKALALLGRKCGVVIKTDLAGGSPDGSMGAAELQRVQQAFGRLLKEGKVSVVDTQALPMPEVHKRGEAPKRKRGGVKEWKRRERQMGDAQGIEKAMSRVKMGVSEEEQREAYLRSDDLRLEMRKQQETLKKEVRKRTRDEALDEYSDLLNITL